MFSIHFLQPILQQNCFQNLRLSMSFLCLKPFNDLSVVFGIMTKSLPQSTKLAWSGPCSYLLPLPSTLLLSLSSVFFSFLLCACCPLCCGFSLSLLLLSHLVSAYLCLGFLLKWHFLTKPSPNLRFSPTLLTIAIEFYLCVISTAKDIWLTSISNSSR